MTLTDIIAAKIRQTGPIPLADYMALALQHPEHGYYTNRDPLGTAGDFTTAPEISQMFGELLGLALAQAWMDQGQPAAFTLAELGPGRGTLMADALRATASVPGFHHAAQVVFVETSPKLKAVQAQAVARATWACDVAALPDQPLFLIANEFFDALPIHQFRRAGQAWQEHLIGLHNGKLVSGWSEPVRQRALAERLADTKEGDVIETCPMAQDITAQVAAKTIDYGGAAIVMDYGDWQSLGDTFQAIQGHAKTDPLASPGRADLTAHVDFHAVSQAANPARVSRMTPQGVVLERLGITARAQSLAQNLAGAALDQHISAHRRLTHPDEMGHLFKGLAIVAPQAPMIAGFEDQTQQMADL